MKRKGERKGEGERGKGNKGREGGRGRKWEKGRKKKQTVMKNDRERMEMKTEGGDHRGKNRQQLATTRHLHFLFTSSCVPDNAIPS